MKKKSATTFKHFFVLSLLVLSSCTGIQTHSNYLKGSNLFKKDHFTHAYFYIRQAVNETPDNAKYTTMLAWITLKRGQPKKAEKIILHLEKKFPNKISVIQISAWIAYALNKNEKARSWFQKELNWARGTNAQSVYNQSIRSDAYYGLGLIQSRLGQYQEARKHFQKALSYKNEFIGHRPIQIARANTYFYSKAYDKAKKAYEQIPTNGPDSHIDSQIGWCLYYSGKYLDAELFLLDKLHAAKNKSPFLYGLIFSTSALQKYNLSKQYLEKLIQRDPDVADTSFIWQLIISNNWQDIPMKFANQYYLKGNFRRASQLSQMVLKKNPLHCQAQHVDIWCDLYQSHAMLALSQFNQFVANDSCNPVNGTIGQGVSLLYLGYFADAKSVLNTITTQSPHYLRSQVALGAIAYLEGDFQNAIDVYESRRSELLEIKDQFWPFLNLNSLGWSYIYQREYKNAETVFNQLDDIHNHLSGLHLFGLAWAKYKQGKMDDAVERLLDYPVDTDNHFKESMLLANAFYLKSDFDEAIAIYKEYMSDLPSKELFFSWGSYALQNLGWCYIHTHQYQKALQTFFKLKTYHPAPIYFVIYDNLGWAYYYLGMIDEAEKAFKYSLKIAPTNQLARDGMKKIIYYRNRRT